MTYILVVSTGFLMFIFVMLAFLGLDAMAGSTSRLTKDEGTQLLAAGVVGLAGLVLGITACS
jgi:hypothetical protein